MINRNFKCKAKKVILLLYKSIVWPHLDYCVQAWRPHYRKDVDKLEKVQRRGAGIIIIIIMNFYSPVSNTRCHSIGHKMRIARIKIRVDSQRRWERA